MKKEQKQKENEMSAVAEKKLIDEALPMKEPVALIIVPPSGVPAIVEQEMPLALVEKPKKKRKVSAKSLKALRNYTIARKKNIEKQILDVLHYWAFDSVYKETKGGMLINLCESLEANGLRMKQKTVREHVLRLAAKSELFCERMVYDPRKTYKKNKNKLPKGYFFEYYVALNGDNNERGLCEYVFHISHRIDCNYE